MVLVFPISIALLGRGGGHKSAIRLENTKQSVKEDFDRLLDAAGL